MATTLGVVLALVTAVLWAISPLCFASAGRRVGAVPVALTRILLASGVLVAALPGYYLLGFARFAVPTGGQVAWLLVSGVAGIAVGDILTYEALVSLGPRRTTQLYTIQPVAAVAAGYLAGEALGAGVLVGVAIVIGATTAAIFARPAEGNGGATAEPGRMTRLGLAYGTLGAVFNGLGAVAGRQAYRYGPELDPFLATTIRVVGSTGILWLIPVLRGTVGETVGILRAPGVASRVLAGTAVGPVVGMVCYMVSLKYAPAGLVSTIVSTSPLLVLPYVTVKYRARLGVVTPVAAAVACGGVAMITNPALTAIVTNPSLVVRLVQRLVVVSGF